MEKSDMNQQSTSGVSVIIPAYNEEAGLDKTITDIKECLQPFSTGLFEIIVVDDGSTDKTPYIARRQGVVLLHHARNMGYGASLKSGIRHAKYDTIVMIDADGTYPPSAICSLVDAMKSGVADMAVGARKRNGPAISNVRRPSKWILVKLSEFFVSRKIADLNSGLRAFRRDTILQFIPLLPDGFSFTTTITLAMLTNGFDVEYIPIDYHPRKGKSKIRPFRDTISFLLLIMRMGLFFAPLKFFFPIAFTLMGTAIFWGFFSYLVLGKLADVSTMIIMVSGIQTLLLGLLAEVINKRGSNRYEK